MQKLSHFPVPTQNFRARVKFERYIQQIYGNSMRIRLRTKSLHSLYVAHVLPPQCALHVANSLYVCATANMLVCLQKIHEYPCILFYVDIMCWLYAEAVSTHTCINAEWTQCALCAYAGLECDAAVLTVCSGTLCPTRNKSKRCGIWNLSVRVRKLSLHSQWM